MKKRILISLVVLIVGLVNILLVTNSYAEENFSVKKESINLDAYKKWSELEDKENYIMPSISKTPYVDKNAVLENDSNAIESEYNLKAGSSLPAKYDPRDEGSGIELVVRDQMHTSSCWAFTATNLFSINLQKRGVENEFIKFSPKHVDYATSKTFRNNFINPTGYSREIGGGNVSIAFGYMAAGYGPVLEDRMSFSDYNSKIDYSVISSIGDKGKPYKLDGYEMLPSIYKLYDENKKVYGYYADEYGTMPYSTEDVKEIRKEIKQAIKDNGGVSATTKVDFAYFDITGDSDNFKNYYCYNSDAIADHAITIVGWDDNYPASNFKTAPKNNGAYIILNSHGSQYYDQGYMYVSYDDFLIESSVATVTDTSKRNYNNIYQYDEYGYLSPLYVTQSPSVTAINVFNSKYETNKREKLTEISLYVPEYSKVELYVNPYNDRKDILNKVKDCGYLDAGYHTIKLSSPIEIQSNKFIVGAKFYSNEGGQAAIPIETTFKSYLDFMYQLGEITAQECAYYKNMAHPWNSASSKTGQSFIQIAGKWYDAYDIIRDSNVCIKAFTQVENYNSVTGIKIDKSFLRLVKGQTGKLTATVTPSTAENKNVKWYSPDPSIVSVDQNGNLTAHDTGEVTITVSTIDRGYVAKCDVRVVEQAQSVTLKKSSVYVLSQSTYTIPATVSPSTASIYTVKWSSSNPSVATVSDSGVVTAKKVGTTTISAKGSNGVESKCVINVIFKDVYPTDWYFAPVNYVYTNNIITGYDSAKFGPNDNLTRGMLVTILYRMEGSPSISKQSTFNDVKNSSEYFYKPVVWAASKGIVSGYNPTTFAPNDNITREQLAVMLNKYAKYKGKKTTANANLNQFKDGKQTSSWAQAQMKWAVGVGILRGNDNGTLNPLGNATRAEAATMLQRYCERIGR